MYLISSAESGSPLGDNSEVGLFIPLPARLAKKCPSLAPVDHSAPHVTFLYVGAVPEGRTEEFLRIVQECCSDLRDPVRASLSKTDHFMQREKDQSVAHMRIHFDQDLAALRWSIRESLEAAGFIVQDSFPTYRPHTTLAYMEGLYRQYKGPRPYGGWSFDSVEVWGLPQKRTIPFGVPLSKQAKYQKKVKDDKGNTHYEYGPGQIAERHKEKAEAVEKLRKSMGALRESVVKDLKSKDDEIRLTALAVALIDATYERVGNAASAKDGHFGVTGWQAKHVKIEGGKATITYVGKSGVSQKKTVDDSRIVSVLKDALKGKSDADPVLGCGDDKCITSTEVNEYLSKYKVTAKDLRGYHANREMQERLVALRKKGPKLPAGRKEKDKVLKGEFDKALKETAAVVGHEEATLRSNYLVPGLEDEFMQDGSVSKELKKSGTKTHAEKEDQEASRLVRPSPKKKPPRKDLRKDTIEVENDPDTPKGDGTDDPDLTLNYKRVAQRNSQSCSYNGTIIGEREGHGEGFPPLFSQNDHNWRGIMPRMTKKGAQQVVAELERVADLMQGNWEDLGVPKRAALDLAYRCDLLSDHIEKISGLQKSEKNPGFDPSQIGDEGKGALEADKEEDYTKENFTSQENSELREKQEAGKLPKADKAASTHGFDLFA